MTEPNCLPADLAETLAPLREANRLIQNCLWFDAIDSTQCLALGRANAGARNLLVVADRQSAGRGRNGRDWFSPAGVGIWCSIVLRPTRPRHEWPILTSLAALAIREALELGPQLKTHLKWPNDIVCGVAADLGRWQDLEIDKDKPNSFFGRKIAGLLADSADHGQAVVMGMGINVNQPLEAFPESLAGIATSVQIEKGTLWDRWRLLSLLLNKFSDRFERFLAEGPAAVLPELIAATPLIGRHVGVNVSGEEGGGEVTGQVRTLGRLGELILAGDDNRSITGGRLKWVSPPFLEEC
jgi:BirA family transcriptional regulator, biotin operon repressor / biotin---[acetyl-CoA-carboxylase] ligase